MSADTVAVSGDNPSIHLNSPSNPANLVIFAGSVSASLKTSLNGSMVPANKNICRPRSIADCLHQRERKVASWSKAMGTQPSSPLLFASVYPHLPLLAPISNLGLPDRITLTFLITLIGHTWTVRTKMEQFCYQCRSKWREKYAHTQRERKKKTEGRERERK